MVCLWHQIKKHGKSNLLETRMAAGATGDHICREHPELLYKEMINV